MIGKLQLAFILILWQFVAIEGDGESSREKVDDANSSSSSATMPQQFEQFKRRLKRCRGGYGYGGGFGRLGSFSSEEFGGGGIRPAIIPQTQQLLQPINGVGLGGGGVVGGVVGGGGAGVVTAPFLGGNNVVPQWRRSSEEANNRLRPMVVYPPSQQFVPSQQVQWPYFQQG